MREVHAASAGIIIQLCKAIAASIAGVNSQALAARVLFNRGIAGGARSDHAGFRLTSHTPSRMIAPPSKEIHVMASPIMRDATKAVTSGSML